MNLKSKRALTEREAAEYSGFSLTAFKENRLYGPRNGHIPPAPHVKLGRSIRYLIDDLDRWLESHRHGLSVRKEGA
jgi:predicted DNA-binding transcriptional regulator AlpA